MDLFRAISSINKIGIIFFVITLGALLYEIFHFKKETKAKKPVLKIPEFNPNAKPLPQSATPLVVEETSLKSPTKRPSFVPIIITSVILLSIGGFVVLGFVRGDKESTAAPTQPTEVVPTKAPILSEGIKVFDINWQLLSSFDIKNLPVGTTIYIGIATIPGSDIDQARIRINQSEWTAENITDKFNPDENVYYIEYVIPPDNEKIIIEGQLHSLSSDWPKE